MFGSQTLYSRMELQHFASQVINLKTPAWELKLGWVVLKSLSLFFYNNDSPSTMIWSFQSWEKWDPDKLVDEEKWNGSFLSGPGSFLWLYQYISGYIVCGYINSRPRSPAIRSMTGCFGVLPVSGESKQNIPSPVVANKSNIDDWSLGRFGKRPHFYMMTLWWSYDQ